jgi:hypothetical protein
MAGKPRKKGALVRKSSTGRPTNFSTKVAERFIQRISNGESLYHIIMNDTSMPSTYTLAVWLAHHSDFASEYARARMLGAEMMASQTLVIADTPRMGTKTKTGACMKCGGLGRIEECKVCNSTGQHPERPTTWRCGACRCKPCGGTGVITETWSGDMVERSRLQVDARRWYAGKVGPRSWGNLVPQQPEGVKRTDRLDEVIKAMRAPNVVDGTASEVVDSDGNGGESGKVEKENPEP